MKKILIPNNSLLTPLHTAIDDSKYNVSKSSELQLIKEIKNNKFDFALISPLVYAQIFNIGNFGIVKSKLLAIEDFSGEISINIRQNIPHLEKIYFEEINEFIIVATKLLLSERFGITTKLVATPNEADIIISKRKSNINYNNYLQLDLTEDWFDTFEIPLICGFWIMSRDNFSNNSIPEINSFADTNLMDIETIHSVAKYENDYDRIGYKSWDWKDSYEQVLDKIFDLLFYRNYSQFIADIKFCE